MVGPNTSWAYIWSDLCDTFHSYDAVWVKRFFLSVELCADLDTEWMWLIKKFLN